jgi:hypothetical protein
MMHLTIKVLFIEAAACEIVGFIAGLVVVIAQGALAACEAGCAIEARLHRRKHRGGH